MVMKEQTDTRYDQAAANMQLVPAEAKKRLGDFWKAHQKQILAVTAGKDIERISRVTYSLLYRSPKLIECTPFSLLNGIVLAHQLGLIFGTQEVALVPFGREATLIIQYQGKIKLALASKLITSVHCEIVLDGEPFELCYKTDGPFFEHRPQWKDRQEPTEQNTVGAYCQLKTAIGGVQTTFVSLQEILAARSRSRGYQYQERKGTRDNAWYTDWAAMAKKTAIHRAMKLAPQDPTLGLATAIDDEDAGGPPVIAEGLDVSQFDDKSLMEPLIELSNDAQNKVAEEKLAALGQPQTVIPTCSRLPDADLQDVGHKLRYKGTVYAVVEIEGEGRKWQAQQEKEI